MTEGWFCPRCKKINAPWVSQCTCTECHKTITTNIPVTGDPPFAWPSNLKWTTCCDTSAKTVPSAFYADKISSVTGTCNCSDKAE